MKRFINVKNDNRKKFLVSASGFRFKLKFIFKNIKLPIFFDFFRWKIVDLYRFSKNPRSLHMYGIRAYVGLYGGGKTISLVSYLERLKKRYGDSIIICTNFYYKNQDFHLDHWELLLKNYDRPAIFAIDEIQNEFNSRDYKNFPVELMYLLTQNRKGFGKQILYTAQDYETVDKNFRRLTQQVTVCRTYLGRLTRTRTFERLDFESMINTANIKNKLKHRAKSRFSFVQSDYLREQYDSFQMLETAKSKEYLSRVETD